MVLSVRYEHQSTIRRRARIANIVYRSLDFDTIIISRVHPLWRRAVLRHNIQHSSTRIIPAREHGVIP